MGCWACAAVFLSPGTMASPGVCLRSPKFTASTTLCLSALFCVSRYPSTARCLFFTRVSPEDFHRLSVPLPPSSSPEWINLHQQKMTIFVLGTAFVLIPHPYGFKSFPFMFICLEQSLPILVFYFPLPLCFGCLSCQVHS